MIQNKTIHCIARTALLLVALIAVVAPGASAFAGEPGRSSAVMAGFLYKFFSFTEWPAGVYPPEGENVAICILGEDPFGTVFAEVEGSDIAGRFLEIKKLGERARIDEMSACQILFVSYSLAEKVPAILQSIAELPILAVSDIEGFAAEGGAVEFFEQDAHIRFIINKGAAERHGIVFRAKLLRVAAEVYD